MQYRRALARAVLAEQKRAKEAAEGEKAPDYGVQLPRFTANCYGCGICEKLCPQKAIEIGPEKDGTRLIYWSAMVCPHSTTREVKFSFHQPKVATMKS